MLVVCALKRHVESSGGNPDRRDSSQPEALGADQEVTNGLKHSKTRLRKGVSRPCGLQRVVNTEQAPKPMPRKPTRHNHGEGRRRRRRDEKRILRFRRGMGWQHAWDRFNVQQGNLKSSTSKGSPVSTSCRKVSLPACTGFVDRTHQSIASWLSHRRISTWPSAGQSPWSPPVARSR